LLKRLEADIRNRCETNDEIDAPLRAEYEKAKSASRTAQAYEVWREDYITQVAVAWILGCVFVRFLEDNRLIDTVWLAGPNDRLQLARDQHTLYFQANPTHSDREYLEHVFEEVAKLPSMRELLDGSHNPISKLGPTGDGAHELLEFWQKVDPATGAIIHDFTDAEWSTRFLGDLYQDLSESARDRYALLQTPEFVEEFILDRTLTPAVEEFGYSTVKMIDPACGSGHFLLGGFRRILGLRLRHEPGVAVRAQVEATLGQVFGVDVNPFAAAIARFRLLVAALRACGVQRLVDAPGFEINIATGDSLLHGPSPRGLVGVQRTLENDPLRHYYDIEDAEQLRQFLTGQYHVVVGNPPYITVKDAALNQAYRTRFQSCHMKYSLAVPFKERFFDLAIHPEGGNTSPAGFLGLITANSFMKREFGRKLIEEFMPRWDLTHVVDTSGAYIPGHGTPTVILFGRNRRPMLDTLRAVMGIRGEPCTPANASEGKVWTAIMDQLDRPGSQSDFVSVTDAPRNAFCKHPWSISGGGAADLKLTIDSRGSSTLNSQIESIGFMAITGEDEFFAVDQATLARRSMTGRPRVTGDGIRDWVAESDAIAVFPYQRVSEESSKSKFISSTPRPHYWPFRTTLRLRSMFGKTPEQYGFQWFEYMQFIQERVAADLLIAFPEIASHNHFVLARGGWVFNQTAPVIKLRDGKLISDHLALLALLDSSSACFWMKQVAHQKQMTGGDGVRVESRSKVPYQFSGTQLGKLPLPSTFDEGPLRERLGELGSKMDQTASELSVLTAEKLLQTTKAASSSGVRSEWQDSLRRRRQLRARMVWLQEEIDFTVYSMYELGAENLHYPSDEPPQIDLEVGQRPFEILSGANEDGFDVPTEIPATWPDDIRSLWRSRIEAIQRTPDLKLIEDPHYKRRWIGRQGVFNHARDTDEFESACANWMRDRLEHSDLWRSPELKSCARIGESMHGDERFRLVAELYLGRPDFDMTDLIAELIEPESVPILPMLCYKDSGRRKRMVWERTWDMQRREDAIDTEVEVDNEIPISLKAEVAKKRKAEEIGEIPAPPKYDSKDFQKQSYWSRRGKLDVPKERFISFPFCERDVDQTPVNGWAGWDHLQQAQAIAAYYERVKNQEGWTSERRVPLLAGILELIPWLKQWHNAIHPEYKERMGTFFQQFVEDEARVMEMTVDQIRGWTPPVQSNSRGRKKRNT
jgi:hypothetical protein